MTPHYNHHHHHDAHQLTTAMSTTEYALTVHILVETRDLIDGARMRPFRT